jgi:hypothetical protein
MPVRGILGSLCVLTICFSHNAHIQHNRQPQFPVTPLSPICCFVLFTQSHLFAVPNTVLSVRYRSYATVYMVTICSASTGG